MSKNKGKYKKEDKGFLQNSNIYLTVDKNNQSKSVITYKRNNITFNDFSFMEDIGYVFYKRYSNSAYFITTKIIISSANFIDIFRFKSTSFEARGSKEKGFRVSIKFTPVSTSDLNHSIKIQFKEHINNISVECTICGNLVEHFNKKHKNNTIYKRKNKNKHVCYIHKSGKGSTRKGIYSTNQWYFNHPYSGGSCTPR